MKEKLLSLRPYVELIEKHCNSLSKKELMDIILGLAKEVPSRKRIEFLDKISDLSRKGVHVSWSGDILQQIEALKEDILNRIASIEDGSYYEDYDDLYYYDDEEPDPVSGEQKEELEGFFKEASDLFLSDQLEEARKIYETLFDLLNNPDPSQDYYSSPLIPDYHLDIEMREARARYCRCVYETSNPKDRTKEMLEAIDLHAPLRRDRFDIYENNYPMLLDVVNAKTGELPEWGKFLFGWKEALLRENTDRANLLLLEAVDMMEGLDGVKRHVHKWKQKQPMGYLYWIQQLESRGDWKAVASACEEALSVLPQNNLRAQAAKKLVSAGGMLNKWVLVLKGKREVFYSLPGDSHLLVLLEEAQKHDERSKEITGVLDHLYRKEKEKRSLLVKALLMAGRLGEAFEKAKRSKALGWSYGENEGAVLFAAILSALVLKRIDEANIIKKVLERYADSYMDKFSGFEEEEKTEKNLRVSDEILLGLKDIVISEEEKQKYITWAENLGKRRIDSIVSNKHRKAYRRAAEVLVALAECFYLLGEKDDSKRIIEDFRNKKYYRYYAFRGEVDTVISWSSLLKHMIKRK